MHESELLRQSFSDYVGHLKHKQKSVASALSCPLERALSHPAFFLSIFYFKFEKQAADFKKSLFKKRAETKCVAIAPSPFSSLLLLFSRERREDLKGKQRKGKETKRNERKRERERRTEKKRRHFDAYARAQEKEEGKKTEDRKRNDSKENRTFAPQLPEVLHCFFACCFHFI